MSIEIGRLERREEDEQQIDEETTAPEKRAIRSQPSPFDVYVDVIRATSR